MLESLKNIQKISFDDLYNTFLGMDKRQQALTVVGLLVLVLICLWLPAHILSLKIAEKEDEYQSYQRDAMRLRQALNDYTGLQAELNKSSASGSEDDLSGLIYNMAEQFGIPKKKVSLKSIGKLPQADLFEQDGKDVEIKSVPFDQLMRLIHGLETSTQTPVVLKKLVLKVDKKNRQVINQASFTVMTIKGRK